MSKNFQGVVFFSPCFWDPVGESLDDFFSVFPPPAGDPAVLEG